MTIHMHLSLRRVREVRKRIQPDEALHRDLSCEARGQSMLFQIASCRLCDTVLQPLRDAAQTCMNEG